MSDDERAKATRWAPGARLAPAALAAIPLALGGGTLGFVGSLAFDAALVIGAAIDARRLAARAPHAERHHDPRLVLGARNRVAIRLHNASEHAIRVTVRDDLPDGWRADPDELVAEIPAHARRELVYHVVPPARGVARFGDLHVRIEGGLGLGAAIASVPAAEETRVYPNVLGTRRRELAMRVSRLVAPGMRSVRVLGGGGEFEQLREYVHGDPFRDLDWKSTAKRHRPVTRVLQQERSQQVLLAIDAGRMMASRAGDGSTKLDHAIHAALLLAYVALRQGDRVGLVVFASDVRVFVPPGRGATQYRRLLEAVFAVEAELTHVDVRRLVDFVRARVPRRALVVLLGDLLDEAHAMPLATHAAVLRRKHLPLCVTMRDPVADELASAPAARDHDAYVRAAAADLVAERAAMKAHLRHAGIGVVEAPPGELGVAAVGRYLELKARSVL
ncbi:DUF58 domain-containing protein [Sandaracinus amylolyticus]|uniref:DUF58 domain-containing protein n=1 Tax=Sandaracinus amylolyticus TaxID=927083 RepID=UPI001F23F724|nr:DUF58 domain-containing protein [Sandaracinus amylolyticus]UJR81633.1 DUF58 domain-containing protein [Sandaracinus amylolyticus]